MLFYRVVLCYVLGTQDDVSQISSTGWDPVDRVVCSFIGLGPASYNSHLHRERLAWLSGRDDGFRE